MHQTKLHPYLNGLKIKIDVVFEYLILKKPIGQKIACHFRRVQVFNIKIHISFLSKRFRNWMKLGINKICCYQNGFFFLEKGIFNSTGIPRFKLLMWGHVKKPRKRKPRKSRLLSSTKGEENRIES